VEVLKAKCKCGWEGSVKAGKILSIICPKCGKKVWIKRPKVKRVVKKRRKKKVS